jgi:tripartite-type tricarboxylate transporter receptor subunit TctC
MRRIWGALALLGTLAAPDGKAADFYQGKTIRMIVGSAVGFSYDTYARMVAAHMPKYIPGNPPIVVQNMIDGAGTGGANYVFNVAQKDGTVIAGFDRDALLRSLLGDDLSKFKLDEFLWLGAPASYQENAFSIFIRSTLPYQHMDQVRKAPETLIFGNRGSVFPHVVKDALGANIKVLEGYRGEEVNLAFERGEVHGAGTSYINLVREKPDWLSQKFIRIIAQFGHDKRLPGLSDVPTARELAHTPADLEFIKFCELSLTLGYPFAAPPGVPQDRMDVLKKAFNSVMVDPDFKAALDKAGLEHSPKSAEGLAADARQATNASSELIARYKRVAGAIGGRT